MLANDYNIECGPMATKYKFKDLFQSDMFLACNQLQVIHSAII